MFFAVITLYIKHLLVHKIMPQIATHFIAATLRYVIIVAFKRSSMEMTQYKESLVSAQT